MFWVPPLVVVMVEIAVPLAPFVFVPPVAVPPAPPAPTFPVLNDEFVVASSLTMPPWFQIAPIPTPPTPPLPVFA
ncbi:hypothetical protein D3C71_1866510 [compost metagenome]